MKGWYDYTDEERASFVSWLSAHVSPIDSGKMLDPALAYLREPKRECGTCAHFGEPDRHKMAVCARRRLPFDLKKERQLCEMWEPKA